MPAGILYKHKPNASSGGRYQNQIAGSAGSIISSFSPDGELVAFHCSATAAHDHEIIILSVQTLRPVVVLRGHLGIVYALNWFNSNTLATVSSDHTAIVWCIDSGHYQFKVLPHPSYLYAVKCLDLTNNGDNVFVVTGGRDAILRIWHVFGDWNDVTAIELMQELSGSHQNYITAIVAPVKGDQFHKFYSSDMSGIIIEWASTKIDSKNRKCFESMR